MNIFVLCTGRCGSTSFIKACSHINNYTSAHESRILQVGRERLSYPLNHIEADNRLSWMLGSLDARYGTESYYVHLIRNREQTAQSYNRRWTWPTGIMKAYTAGIRCIEYYGERKADRLKYCYDYYDDVNQNILQFLKDKPNKLTVHLENHEHDFTVFWNEIGAQGNLNEALKSLSQKSNLTIHIGRMQYLRILLKIFWREVKYVWRE